MAQIGTFTKTADGFNGTLNTLTIANKKIKIVSAEKSSDNSPDYRVFHDKTEIGGGWEKTSKTTGTTYVSLRLDDPSFPAPVFANLITSEDSDEHKLLWTRPTSNH